MNKDKKLELLRNWQAAYDRNELATKPLRELIGDIPNDSVIYKAMWDTFDELTKTTAMLILDIEVGQWGVMMSWYELECGMGKTPKEIDGTLVDSVDVLVNFI